MPDTTAAKPFVESVLHPTDFSPASNRAFAHALAIALIWQTELTILHIGPENRSDVDWTRFPPVRETLERWGLLQAGSPRSAVFDEFRVKVKKTAVRSRHPLRAIATYVDHQPVDLIVLATEGREGAQRWINRSDAEAIARWAKTMALFVPARAERGLVALEDGYVRLRNILLPIDNSPDARAAIAVARRAAEILGDGNVAIRLLHVGDSRPPVPALSEGPEWSWQVELRKGEPVDEILAVAIERAADLIVMPTAGRDGVLDALRGSTTEQVLRRAPCPLLAVPG